jgi:hypothetical protein
VAELTAGGERVWLGTFNSPEEVARAYDAACWRFGRVPEWLNFPEITTQAKADSSRRHSRCRCVKTIGVTSTRS